MTADLADWLETAAEEKADSVAGLAPPSVKTVIDVGAGTGAVLAALDRRGFADQYWACEPSSDLAGQIPAIDRLVGVEVGSFDGAFEGKMFDLAILSHVLEHVRAPARLLSQVLERAAHVIVEVPIEASFVTRARTRGTDRARDHPAGHVHFFSENDARKLVSVAGGRLLAERAYFPFSPYRRQANGLPQQVMLTVAERWEWLARRHYEHFAMLATTQTFEEWDHHYPRPE
jgi:SAM-dependent methyltransferase